MGTNWMQRKIDLKNGILKEISNSDDGVVEIKTLVAKFRTDMQFKETKIMEAIDDLNTLNMIKIVGECVKFPSASFGVVGKTGNASNIRAGL